MMDVRIWKFPFQITDEFTLQMPQGARVLHVDMQHDIPCLWALVDATRPKTSRSFRVVGTGNPFRDALNLRHVGTFQMMGGGLVWHVFEPTSAPWAVRDGLV
jgi:hypothetical protein